MRDTALRHVVERVSGGDGPVVDIATGRGMLLERLAGATSRPIVATDISPTILGRVRTRLAAADVMYVAADAHALPFRDASIPTLVSHVGLANVPDAPSLLRELRRAGASLYATHVLYEDSDEANRNAARARGIDTLLFRETALRAFAEAGWRATFAAERAVRSEPTSASAVIPSVEIDALPVQATRVTWCVVEAS